MRRAEFDDVGPASFDRRQLPGGFARSENRLSFFAVTEQFLAENLGGRSEPIGQDFKGSSIAVPEGAQYVKGVAEALGQTQGQPASGRRPQIETEFEFPTASAN